MVDYILKILLKSDATFGSGEGLAGALDTEVQHDKNGFPFIGGRTLKGLLAAASSDILYALNAQGLELFGEEFVHLFGRAGSTENDTAILHVGDGQLPLDLQQAVTYEVDHGKFTREEVLNSLTAIRRQTAIDASTGAPKQRSLRSSRVILRETPFESKLTFFDPPTDRDLTLLAASVKAFRRVGTGGNRGRGDLVACLCSGATGEDVTDAFFDNFRTEVCG